MNTRHTITAILFCTVMFLFNFHLKSQNNSNSTSIDVNTSINKGYSEKIFLYLVKTKEYKDTILTFRNYINGNDKKRIVCNNLIIDKDIEDLIWGCKHIELYLSCQQDMNKFSFISYIADNQNNTIVKYFLCDRESMKAVEMKRFLIKDKRIIGINIAPDMFEGHTFTPIEEFEKIKDFEPFFLENNGEFIIGN